jgi:hypothetical protein
VDRPDGWLVSRQHVLDLLPVMRLTPAQRQRLLALRYPLPLARVAPEFDSLGIDVDTLVDRMGGSP